MQTYFLSVLRSVGPFAADPRIATVLHVYRIEVAQPLAWMRQHADEMARCAHGPDYCALMVSETRPS